MQTTTKLAGLTRLTNTESGNPRWMVHTPAGSWRTEPDSQCANLLSEAMVGQTVGLTVERGTVRKVEVSS